MKQGKTEYIFVSPKRYYYSVTANFTFICTESTAQKWLRVVIKELNFTNLKMDTFLH